MIQFPITGDWQGCYGKTWKGLICDDSMSHPAKFSRNLIKKIYQYLLEEDLVKQGDTIHDPFGGVGLGAFHALQSGLFWVGVELEPKFVGLGHKNIALWESLYRGKLPNWAGQAILLQGDSRRLIEVLQQNGVEAVVSSPPYVNVDPRKNNGSVDIQKQYATYKASGGGQSFEAFCHTQANHSQGYGESGGQLSALPKGNFQAVVTSSPFAGNSGGQGEASRNGIDASLFDRHQGGMVKGISNSNGNLGAMPPKQSDLTAIVTSSPFVDSVGSDDPDKRGGLYRDSKRRGDVNLTGTYGDSDGQLGAMKAGEIKGVVGSPPYSQANTGGQKIFDKLEKKYQRKFTDRSGRQSGYRLEKQGNSSGQLADIPTGDTFWSAARLILEQCYLLLPIGGTAVFVTKDFVKNGQKVEFSSQWAELCQAVGFAPYAHFRAWQVKPGPVQTAMIGEDKDYTKEYKSFFRRLHEKKNPAISVDWEDVLVFRKEASQCIAAETSKS